MKQRSVKTIAAAMFPVLFACVLGESTLDAAAQNTLPSMSVSVFSSSESAVLPSLFQDADEAEYQEKIDESASEGDFADILAALQDARGLLDEEEWVLLVNDVYAVILESAMEFPPDEDAESKELIMQIYEILLEDLDEGDEIYESISDALTKLRMQQALQDSLASFLLILEKDPENTDAMELIAELYGFLDDPVSMVTYYEMLLEAIEDTSLSTKERSFLTDIVQEKITEGYIFIAENKSGEEALKAWLDVVDWDPSIDSAWLTLANIYLDMDDVESASAILEEGIEQSGVESLRDLYEEITITDFELLVQDIIADITTEDMSLEEKRRACYDYIIDNTTYVRTYDTPSGDWTQDYATDVLVYHQGNCFRYAAAFAYMCKELGYDVKVCTGQISASAGGTTAHGWTVLTIDGVEYICDADMEQAKGGDYYMKTFADYPVKPLITQNEWEISF